MLKCFTSMSSTFHLGIHEISSNFVTSVTGLDPIGPSSVF